MLSAYCRRNGVSYLDLLEVFRQQGAGGGLYLPRNTHYNQAGNERAAETIDRFLGRDQLVLR